MKKINKLLSLTIFTFILIFTSIIRVSAASARISVSSSTSRVVVGNTFSVNVTVSSSSALGSWEWTINYDKSKLKLVSGDANVADVFQKANTKSKTYTYKFKAIGTGNASVGVKSYNVIDVNEKNMSVSAGSKSISIITQAQLEASYSKNNNLKSLSVNGYKLTPTFSKNVTEYSVEASSNTEEVKISASAEDSKSSISGTGTHKVSEGENKFKITVTAENGSNKTYTIIVNVKDPNPITITIDNKEYTIIKRESLLEVKDGFEKKTIKINEQDIPALYNELNHYTIVGLKDKEGNIDYFIYDSDKNEYNKYIEIAMDDVKLYPLNIDEDFIKSTETNKDDILSKINKVFDGSNLYTKTTININNVEFEALKLNKNSEFAIIHARNLLTGKDEYYTYDTINNTVVRYTNELKQQLDNKINKYKTLILILGAETIIIILVLICILIKQVNDNKKRRELYNKLEEIKNKENTSKKEELKSKENAPKKEAKQSKQTKKSKKKMSDENEIEDEENN